MRKTWRKRFKDKKKTYKKISHKQSLFTKEMKKKGETERERNRDKTRKEIAP